MRKLSFGLMVVMLGGCRAATVDVAAQPIVGGTLTTGYPFVGYVSAEFGGGTSSGCTGTLVRDRWVLTAAHCIEEDMGPIAGVKVTFEADANQATVWHTAKSWRQHPKYGQPVPPDPVYYINRGYDCALVELDAPVAGVAPIAYGTAAMDATWLGRAVTQVGYGFTDGSFSDSGEKRELSTTIGDVHDGVLGIAENGTGTCQGDSGGPTLYQENGTTQVIGVTSYGSQGCPGGGWMSRTELCAAWLDTVAGKLQPPPDMAAPPDLAQPPSPPVSDAGATDSSDGNADNGDGQRTMGASPGGGCDFVATGATPSCLAIIVLLVLVTVSRRATRD